MTITRKREVSCAEHHICTPSVPNTLLNKTGMNKENWLTSLVFVLCVLYSILLLTCRYMNKHNLKPSLRVRCEG